MVGDGGDDESATGFEDDGERKRIGVLAAAIAVGEGGSA